MRRAVHTFGNLHGGPARLLAARVSDSDWFVLDAPHLYIRDGGPYADPSGHMWGDNAFRFAALSHAAAAIGHGAVAEFVPDVVHAHDWQAGLAPAYLHYAGRPRPGTVMTVHNLAVPGPIRRQPAECARPAVARVCDRRRRILRRRSAI